MWNFNTHTLLMREKNKTEINYPERSDSTSGKGGGRTQVWKNNNQFEKKIQEGGTQQRHIDEINCCFQASRDDINYCH